MNSSSDEWGDMVMPGVFMLQRARIAEAPFQQAVSKDGVVNYELVHLEIQELQASIHILIKSNEEIQAYLLRKREVLNTKEKSTGELEYDSANDEESLDCGDDQCMNALISHDTFNKEAEEETGVLNGSQQSDSDDDVFLEALVENENVIRTKQKEMEKLVELVKDQRCACHFHEQVNQAKPTTQPAETTASSSSSARFTL